MKMKKIVLLYLVLFCMYGFKLFHKEKYLFKAEMKDCEIELIDHLKTKKAIEIKLIAKCDLIVPLINDNQYFYMDRNNPIIYLGWDIDRDLDSIDLKTKFIKKGTSISQIFKLKDVQKIEYLVLKISYISNPQYIQTRSEIQRAFDFTCKMEWSIIKLN